MLQAVGPTPEDYERAGVYDPSDPGADGRLELLEYLSGRGVTLEELTARLGELETLLIDRLLSPPGELTARELVEAMRDVWDNPQSDLTRFWRAAGLPVPGPDERVYTTADLEMLAALASTTEFFDTDTAMQLLRVIGTSLARIADAVVSAYLTEVEHRIKLAGARPLDHALANERGIRTLQETAAWFPELLRHHVMQAVRRSRVARAGITHHEGVRLAVGFIDLTGFTSLTQHLPIGELSGLIANFEATATDVVHAGDGRLVKLIGDEVMFVAVDPLAACSIAWDLVAVFDSRDARLAPRGGIAFGELLWREGDYYGPLVNMAARIVDQAVPGEVLVTGAVRDAVEDEEADVLAGPGSVRASFGIEPAGRRTLKGFDDPVALWSLERHGHNS